MSTFNATPLFNYLGSELGNIINNVVNIDAPTQNQTHNFGNNIQTNLKYYKNVDENHIYLCLEIPGFLKDDCSIDLNGGYLIFEGKSTCNIHPYDKFGETDFDFIKNKNVKTKIDLSNYNIDENNIQAYFNNGLLKIKLKKKPKMNISID